MNRMWGKSSISCDGMPSIKTYHGNPHETEQY
jgi:hypothetical protein